MSYYRYDSPEVLAALRKRNAEGEELVKRATAFCKLFGGRPVFTADVNRSRFRGVELPDTADFNIWTKPSYATPVSWPRVKVKAAHREAWQGVKNKWAEYRLNEDVRMDEFYDAMGVDWANLWLSGASFFEHNDAVYLQTGMVPKPESGVIEILGSEYDAARKAAKS